MTELELINETVSYYSGHAERFAIVPQPSGIGTHCVFKTPTGKKCAVGRCAIDAGDSYWTTQDSAEDHIINDATKFKEHLLPKYRNINLKLWDDLQHLHDCKRFWNQGLLTSEGTAWVHALRNEYK